MKRYPDYKKLLFSAIVLVALVVIPSAFLSGQTAREIQDKINQKDSEIRQLEKEIAAYQTELNGLDKQKSSLSKSIKELDLTQKKLNADIAVTQNKIDKTNLKIKNLSSDINTKEDSINNTISSTKLQIRSISEFEEKSLVETILSDNDFTALWNDVDNIVTVREKIRENTIKLQEVKGALEETRESTIDAKNELTKLKTQLSDQRKIVEQNTAEKNK